MRGRLPAYQFLPSAQVGNSDAASTSRPTGVSPTSQTKSNHAKSFGKRLLAGTSLTFCVFGFPTFAEVVTCSPEYQNEIWHQDASPWFEPDIFKGDITVDLDTGAIRPIPSSQFFGRRQILSKYSNNWGLAVAFFGDEYRAAGVYSGPVALLTVAPPRRDGYIQFTLNDGVSFIKGACQ